MDEYILLFSLRSTCWSIRKTILLILYRIFGSHGLKAQVTFANWMLFGVPLSILNLFLTWIWLQIFFLRCK